MTFIATRHVARDHVEIRRRFPGGEVAYRLTRHGETETRSRAGGPWSPVRWFEMPAQVREMLAGPREAFAAGGGRETKRAPGLAGGGRETNSAPAPKRRIA